jgi:2-methylcitrate dehydratase PrpD
VLIPLLTALIEARRYPLDEFLPALVAGYEAGGALERALVLHTNPAGFRSTAVFGTIAASAAASRLLRLSPEACAAALANAASFAGGLLQSFADGSDEWRYQVGVAARNGWLAAELAAAGSVTAPRAFEGDSGFARAFARVPADATAITARLGQDWAMTRVTFKPYPVCAFNQTPVGAALVLREELGGALIDAVRVRMNPFECNYAGMDSTGPFYSIAGTLMSIPFCIATTLVHGAPDMRRMATYDDAAVNTLLNKVQLIPSPEVPTLCAAIEIDSGARRLHRDERKTARDYAYDRTATINLIRRTCAAENVPLSAVELVERFVDRLPNTSIDEVLSAFTSIEPA